MALFKIAFFTFFITSLLLWGGSTVHWVVSGDPGRTADYLIAMILSLGFLALIKQAED